MYAITNLSSIKESALEDDESMQIDEKQIKRPTAVPAFDYNTASKSSVDASHVIVIKDDAAEALEVDSTPNDSGDKSSEASKASDDDDDNNDDDDSSPISDGYRRNRNKRNEFLAALFDIAASPRKLGERVPRFREIAAAHLEKRRGVASTGSTSTSSDEAADFKDASAANSSPQPDEDVSADVIEIPSSDEAYEEDDDDADDDASFSAPSQVQGSSYAASRTDDDEDAFGYSDSDLESVSEDSTSSSTGGGDTDTGGGDGDDEAGDEEEFEFERDDGDGDEEDDAEAEDFQLNYADEKATRHSATEGSGESTGSGDREEEEEDAADIERDLGEFLVQMYGADGELPAAESRPPRFTESGPPVEQLDVKPAGVGDPPGPKPGDPISLCKKKQAYFYFSRDERIRIVDSNANDCGSVNAGPGGTAERAREEPVGTPASKPADEKTGRDAEPSLDSDNESGSREVGAGGGGTGSNANADCMSISSEEAEAQTSSPDDPMTLGDEFLELDGHLLLSSIEADKRREDEGETIDVKEEEVHGESRRAELKNEEKMRVAPPRRVERETRQQAFNRMCQTRLVAIHSDAAEAARWYADRMAARADERCAQLGGERAQTVPEVVFKSAKSVAAVNNYRDADPAARRHVLKCLEAFQRSAREFWPPGSASGDAGETIADKFHALPYDRQFTYLINTLLVTKNRVCSPTSALRLGTDSILI